MKEDIKREIQKEIDSLGESLFRKEGKIRNEVSQEMKDLIE